MRLRSCTTQHTDAVAAGFSPAEIVPKEKFAGWACCLALLALQGRGCARNPVSRRRLQEVGGYSPICDKR